MCRQRGGEPVSAVAPRYCGPTCSVLVIRGRCPEHTRQQDQHHARFKVGETSYTSSRWRTARLRFLTAHPLCQDCKALGRVRLANTVDHIVPHRGDVALFWDETNWRPSCASCHSMRTARQVGWRQRRGRGV